MRRHGFTLVEVCLVLALLVVLGAISAPLLGGSFARAELQGAGDLLRAAWSRARLAAMESGQAYVFRFQPNGSEYQIVTLTDLGTPGAETLPEVDATNEQKPEDILRLAENRLPEGVIFAAGEVSASSQVLATLGTSDGGTWSSPILFHPNGTTSDATLVLANDAQQTIRVTLRGLTGISNVTEVGKEAVGP
jgi:prepilin-type N-terminal cleavage/methylation domain-containing protein